MEQALMQQELSFEHKMANIHNANSLLDHLERKMNSYFNQPSLPSRNNNHQESDNVGTVNSNVEADLSGQIMKKKTGHGNSVPLKPQFIRNQRKNYLQQPQEQLEFKLYNDFSSHNAKHPSSQIQNQNQRNIMPENSEEAPQPRRQRERLSQTTVYKASSNEPQSRNSNNFSRSRKNEQFRLIGKSREAQREKQVNIEQPDERKQNTNNHNLNNRRSDPNENSYLHLQERNERENYRMKSHTSQNLQNKSYTKSTNNVLHSMQTIEVVMKEALDARMRKIKQIQHEIMTENEQRVYLYKINVRLNEQLKHLVQEENLQQIANSQTLQWTIKTLQQDVQKIKRQIAKKKSERTQLRKQEKTMRDGYQTVLNNKKNILRKDIQMYAEKQSKSKENTEVLRGLMKELDKLKGAVEAKIKTAESKCTFENTKKRKVVKSFKI